MNAVAFWLSLAANEGFRLDRSLIGMYKSELLGRLMRGEEVRRVPCPRHKGRMWCGWGGREQIYGPECACGGTGWLPNPAAPPPNSA